MWWCCAMAMLQRRRDEMVIVITTQWVVLMHCDVQSSLIHQNQWAHRLPIFDTSLDVHQTIHSVASITAHPHHMATHHYRGDKPTRERETRTKHVYASDDSTGLLSPYSSSRGKCRSKPYRWFIICPRLHVAHWLSLSLGVVGWLIDCSRLVVEICCSAIWFWWLYWNKSWLMLVLV